MTNILQAFWQYYRNILQYFTSNLVWYPALPGVTQSR